MDSNSSSSTSLPNKPAHAQEDRSLRCGWWRLRPAWCQVFRSAKLMLFILCCISALQGFSVNGLTNINISTLEQRFDLTSTQAGLIASIYDVASLICLIPVGFFGGLGSKPRWIGFGALILGMGSIVFSIPHFAVTPYQYDVTPGDGICVPGLNSTCAGSKDGGLSNYRHVLNLGQFMHGVGAAPLYTLGVTIIDENVAQDWCGIYLGIFYTMAIIGPAVGYLIGGFLLTVYTDFYKVDTDTLLLDTDDENWVGAWWLGYLVAGIIVLPFSILILAFPRELPVAEKLRRERVSQAHKGTESVNTNNKGITALKDLPRSVKVLVTNPTFMFLNIASAVELILTSGFSTFIPKYVENQYSITASQAALYIGAAVVVAGGGGMLLGGGVVRWFKLKVRGMLLLCVATCVVMLCLIFAFFARCNSISLAGVNYDYVTGAELVLDDLDASNSSLGASCNLNCSCDYLTFDPVCGENGVTYFSPCAAGCTVKVSNEMFTNCTCIGGSAEAGRCSEGCNRLSIFLPFFALMIFVTFMSTLPATITTLRCVPDNQRSFATSIQWIIMRLLGSIPGPIIFGAVIDNSCLLWGQNCDGSRSSCQFYDNFLMSRNLMLISFAVKGFALIMFSASLCTYKAPKDKDDGVELKVSGATNVPFSALRTEPLPEGSRSRNSSCGETANDALHDSSFENQSYISERL